MELESAGIYQDFTGNILKELKKRGEIDKTSINGYPYAVSQDQNVSKPNQEIIEATNQFYDFINSNDAPSFAELASYVALCNAYDVLSNEINIEVLPKGQYPYRLRGVDNELDALVEINTERFPAEVYNGIDYLVKDRSTGSDHQTKLEQVEQRSIENPVASNPILISRICSKDMRGVLRRMNGTVVDTGGIIACKENPKYDPKVADKLNITNRIYEVPELQTEHGVQLDGEAFDEYVTSSPAKILPEKIECAATDLPDTYQRRVRGAVNLLCVNQRYRRASGRVERIASLVVQYSYHRLLRTGGIDRDELFESGWDDLESNYRNFGDAMTLRQGIRDEWDRYLNQLRTQRIVDDRKTGLYARGADHPHTSLTFPEGRGTQ